MKLQEIADITGGFISGNPEVNITGAAGINDATEGSITYLANIKHAKSARDTKASAILLKEKIDDVSASMIIVDNPQLAFALTLELFHKKTSEPAGISKNAFIGNNVSLGKDVSVYATAYISDGVSIGDRVALHPSVYVGNNVSIGDDTEIYPNVTIKENIKIGRNVLIHPGTVIGADGFGYVRDKDRHHKIPQTGGVIIEDDVEIGANVTIDRAAMGNTIIGRGTKIDNLVMIAHNVKIGKNCLLIAQCGIAGSTELGDNVILGGQVGVRDHIKIADGVMIGSKSAAGRDLKPGNYSGIPAFAHKRWLRAQSIYSKLPELLKRLRVLENKVSKEDNPDDG